VLDEPASGLDPVGIRWLRDFLQPRRRRRTILLSSHVLSEFAQTVDDVVVIAGGRLVAHAPLAELTRSSEGSGGRVRVRTPQAEVLAEAMRTAAMTVIDRDGDELLVAGTGPEAIAQLALDNSIVVYGLVAETDNLEDVF
jgi:ABC-2 type transport system ATP-binding protein